MIICFAFVTGFIVAKTFVDLAANIGFDGTIFLYGGISVLGAFMTLIFVPETRKIEILIHRYRLYVDIMKGETIVVNLGC